MNSKMKKILYSLVGAGLLFGATACEDFLDTSSPSETTADFVFSDPTNIRSALYQAYETESTLFVKAAYLQALAQLEVEVLVPALKESLDKLLAVELNQSLAFCVF